MSQKKTRRSRKRDEVRRTGRPWKRDGMVRLVSDPIAPELKGNIIEECSTLETTIGAYLALFVAGLTRAQRVEAFRRSQNRVAEQMVAEHEAELVDAHS